MYVLKRAVLFQISMSVYHTRVMIMQIVQIQLGALPANVEMDLMAMG